MSDDAERLAGIEKRSLESHDRGWDQPDWQYRYRADIPYLLALAARQAEALKAVEALKYLRPSLDTQDKLNFIHRLRAALASADHRDGGDR